MIDSNMQWINTNADEFMRSNVEFWVMLMAIFAFTFLFSGTMQKTSFSTLGENAAEKIRQVLYASILTKHMGWFDNKENGTSVLTSAMAQDTAIVNGVSTESIAPQLEGNMALMAGLAIGFWACW